MKKINFKIIIACSFLALTAVVSCKKDFLLKPTLGTLDPSIIASSDGVNGLLIGAYSLLDGEGASGDGTGSGASNWIYGGIASDDAYKGSEGGDFGDALGPETWTTNSATGIIQQRWTVLWAGVQRSNEVLRILPNAKDISTANALTIKAEARFLRGFYHLEAKKIWNNIPYIDETVTVGSATPIDNTKDAWPMIEADLKFAADNLPELQPQPGRVNKWAALAYQAKAFMYERKYADAKVLLTNIITNGKTPGGAKYALMAHYASNFNAAQKNSSESVFAAQMSVQDGSSTAWGGTPNGNFGDILNFPYNGGPGGCCGFYNPSQDLANAYKTDANGLPLLDTWFTGPGVSRPTGASYAGNLDPRIDVAIGRPGIPYLDWGAHPGDAWIRTPLLDGHFSPKKNVFAAAQKNQYTDNGSAYWAPTELTSNNVNLLRYADVLLWAAECELQPGGNPEAARGFVNQIRKRASDTTGWVYKGSDFDAPTYTYKTQTTAADKYSIGLYPAGSFADPVYAAKAIMFERRLELAMEGQRFFDLVRWGIADVVLNKYAPREGLLVSYKAGTTFTKGKSEYYPIPLSEIDLINKDPKNKLVQNLGY